MYPGPGQAVDLLGSLGLYNSSWAGVRLTDGVPPQIRPAYLLQGKIFPSFLRLLINIFVGVELNCY